MVDIHDYDENEKLEIEEFLAGHKVSVPSDYPLKIYREEMNGKAVYLYTGKGDFLGTVEINKPGNKQYDSEFIHLEDQTYTYTLPNGYEVLLSVPQEKEPPLLFTIGNAELPGFYTRGDLSEIEVAERHCKLMVETDGSLNIRDLESDLGTQAELVTILEPEEDSDMITAVERSLQVPKTWTQISLREDQALYLHTGDFTQPKAVIYKVPNQWQGYVLREQGSGEVYRLDGLGTDNDFYTFSYNGGLALQVRQYDGILEIRADGLLFSDKMAGKKKEYVSAGEDGFFTGRINGGRRVAGFTVKSVGGPELSKYSHLNEDNYGVNYMNGRVVVADGIGGQLHGQHASSLATRWIANSPVSLEKAIQYAQMALRVMGRAIKKSPPDTVFAAAEFQGDYVKYAFTGDCTFIHVKKQQNGDKEGYGIFRTKPHSILQNMINDKDVTEREAYTDTKFAMHECMVTTTLLSSRVRHEFLGGEEVDQVEYGSVLLGKGDYVLMMSDGAKVLTDEDIVAAIEAEGGSGGPEEIVFQLKEVIRVKNEEGGYYRDFHDGKEPVLVKPAYDNTTLVVVRHD